MSVTHNPYEPYCAFCAACAMCQDCGGLPGSEFVGSQPAGHSHCVSAAPCGDKKPRDSGNCNVYVRNLPSSVDDDWLRLEFSRFGLITSAKVMTSHSKKSKGYGFVQYTEPHMAVAAVQGMNGCCVGQYCLNVKLADRDKDRGILNQPSTNLYVSNLPRSYGVTEISALFAPYGAISSMVVLTDPHNGGSRGVSLVRYYSVSSAANAIELLNGRVIPGHDRPLEVKFAENQDEKHLRKATVQKAPGGLNRSGNRQGSGSRAPRIDRVSSTASNGSLPRPMMGDQPQVSPFPMLPTPSMGLADRNEVTRQHFASTFYGLPEMPAYDEMEAQLIQQTNSMTISEKRQQQQQPIIKGPSNSLYIYGLDMNLSELELYKLLAPYGAIVSVRMEANNRRTDIPDDKCCVVQFRSDVQATEAVKGLGGLNVNGKVLTVVAGDAAPSLLPAGA